MSSQNNIKIFSFNTLLFFILIFVKTTSSFYLKNGHHNNITLNNISFGSCYYGRESERLDMFDIILKNNPQMWMWIGDAAYIDVQTIAFYWMSTNKVNFTLAEEIFDQAKNEKNYKKLRENIPTIGIWDDHDFGINDGNGHFAHKEKSKKLYLDFIDEPEYSDRRKPDKPIYTTYSFGHSNSHMTVRIILLDVRYNKTSLVFDNKADILGEEQWEWFENVLADNNETFTLIVSGTQILPFNRIVAIEAWYGSSRKRLFDLLGRLKKSGVILATGDIHAGEFLKSFCVLPEIGYDLFEITTSGLSHYDKDHFLMEYILPTDYNIMPTLTYYNYGKIDFIWDPNSKENSKMKISLIDIDNVVRAEITISYIDLVYDKLKVKDLECYEKINRRYKTPYEYFQYYSKNKFEFISSILILTSILHFFYIIYCILSFIYRKILLIFRIIFKNKEKKV